MKIKFQRNDYWGFQAYTELIVWHDGLTRYVSFSEKTSTNKGVSLSSGCNYFSIANISKHKGERDVSAFVCFIRQLDSRFVIKDISGLETLCLTKKERKIVESSIERLKS
jgi:hypothetical protein